MSDVNHWLSIAQGISPLQMAQLTNKKRCDDCGKIKPLDQFPRDARRIDKHAPICHDCKPDNTEHRKRMKRVYARRYYAANREQVLERQKATYKRFYEANRERLLEKQKAYAKKNRKKLTKKLREWRKNNPDKVRTHKEKEKINREKTLEYARRYREKHREAIYKRKRKWIKKNPERIAIYNQRRREKRAAEKQVNHENPQHHENHPHVNTH